MLIVFLFSLLICVLAAPLLYFHIPLGTSLMIGIVVAAAGTWLMGRAYRRAKKRATEDWRSRTSPGRR